jgi:predicted amidohydrolase
VNRCGIADAVARIRTECAALRIAAVVGTPYYPSSEGGEIWNAAVVIDGAGEVLAVCPKVGLTKSEGLFFAAGTARPAFALGSVGCGVMLCREVRDGEQLRGQLGGARLTFWPGAIAWDSAPADPDNQVTPEIASACARALESYVVQCNWATSLNNPAITGMGGSLVIAPTGDILHRCLLDTPGISIVEIDPAAGPDHPCGCPLVEARLSGPKHDCRFHDGSKMQPWRPHAKPDHQRCSRRSDEAAAP